MSFRSRLTGLAASAAVTIASAGCARAVDAGLALAGVKSSRPTAASVPAPGRSLPVPAPKATTSTYRHAPALFWQSSAVGTPYAPAMAARDRLMPRACAITSPGVHRVIPVPEGAPARPVQTFGPIEVGAAGLPVMEAESLFELGPADLAWRMMERTRRLSTDQDGCGFQIFLYVRLAGPSSTEPVLVSR